MKETDATNLKKNTCEILNDVHFRGERIVVTRYGKPMVTIIPAKDAETLKLSEDRRLERK